MDSNRHEDSGEMYSPDEQGEYMLLEGAPRFPIQGLSDALADVGEGITEPPVEEYAMILEVMMANCPGWPHPPAFSWNVGMVMHVLKNDPVLRELEHVEEAFSEWILHSAYFTISLLPLVEAWQQAVATSNC